MSPTLSPYRLIPMQEEHCAEICKWSYPAPYDIYNWRRWELMLAAHEEFADRRIRDEQYRAVIGKYGSLCGFAQFFPIVGVTRLGLGMRPDLCGGGQGELFVRAIADEAVKMNSGNKVDLEVMTWNERAVRAYSTAGFEITDTYERMTPTGIGEFHCMVWKTNRPEV